VQEYCSLRPRGNQPTLQILVFLQRPPLPALSIPSLPRSNAHHFLFVPAVFFSSTFFFYVRPNSIKIPTPRLSSGLGSFVFSPLKLLTFPALFLITWFYGSSDRPPPFLIFLISLLSAVLKDYHRIYFFQFVCFFQYGSLLLLLFSLPSTSFFLGSGSPPPPFPVPD